METIHFTTTISKSGTISIPDGRTLINREVEVIITPKIKNINTLSNKAKDFINKWGGFINLSEKEDSRYNYLMEKYQ